MPSLCDQIFPPFAALCVVNVLLIFLFLTGPQMATAAANATDSDSDQNSSLPNMEEVEEVFDRYDANGDGKLSMSELGGVLKAMGSSDSPSERQRIMDGIDSDKDEFISLNEFAHLCRTTSDPSQELRDAFDMYDQDGNELISSSELHLVLNRLGLKCSMDDCVEIIRSVDSDGDGNVNFQEFKTMMFDKL
ncbi:probable calcium-binding protein CML26 [Tripterygium wilfordii]|uniref:probable calcium-binding protein CML26 n=1 Tax=Tripterygium wilfordii TaxID=458696 RepID=UPI0018F81F86|nr:probable calcium-binding protein CML26 [Tripterygium wilfordii]